MKTPRLNLRDAYKQPTADQDKILPPAETLRRAREKFGKMDMAILAETMRIDNGRLDIPVFVSICGKDAAHLTGTARQMGKGASPEQAEASAVMELVERFSVYSFSGNPENFIHDTYAGVRESALPFSLIARSVHEEEAEEHGPAGEVFADLPLKWSRAHDLSRDRTVLLPFDWFFAINEFNGTSAGNCLEEAICQGICEVVERHVSARICREKMAVPGIDPASVTDPTALELLGKFKKNGIRLYLSDFTLDMGVPTVSVLAYDPATYPEKSEIVWTAGTATSPQKALCRALSETAQLAGDFNTGSGYAASGLPKLRSLQEASFITHCEACRDIRSLPDIADANIRAEIANCVAALSKKKMSVLVVPTTHPGLEIPACYVVIPGACFRERAAATSMAMFCGKLITRKYPPEQAIPRLEALAEKIPGQYHTQFYLGLCRLEAGDPEGARKYLQKALELEPDPQDMASIYSYTGLCLKETGAWEKALEVLEKGLSWDEERTDILNLMGFCHFKQNQHEKAIRCFERLLQINPGSAIDYANIGVNYKKLGEARKAAAYFETALQMDPDLEFARQGLREIRG